jgi:hypothetical protein
MMPCGVSPTDINCCDITRFVLGYCGCMPNLKLCFDGSIMPLFSSTIFDRYVSYASRLVALNKTYLQSFGCLVVLRCDPVQCWMFMCKILDPLSECHIFWDRTALLGSMTLVVALHNNLKYETHYMHSNIWCSMISLLW